MKKLILSLALGASVAFGLTQKNYFWLHAYDGGSSYNFSDYKTFNYADKNVISKTIKPVACHLEGTQADINCMSMLQVTDKWADLSNNTLYAGANGNVPYNTQPGQYRPTVLYVAFEVTVDYTSNSVFDAATKTLNLNLPSTEWSDIHVKINNGAQQNYRMTKNGDNFSAAIQVPVNNGDVISYCNTSFTNGSVNSCTQWQQVQAEGIQNFIRSATSASYQNKLYVSTLGMPDWIIVHYKRNGVQYNQLMNSNSGIDFEHKVTEFSLLGGVEVSFTYAVNGVATTTGWTLLN